MRDTHDSFLDTLADLDPAEQALQLARALGEIVRAGADDHQSRRDAIENLYLIIERHAGLRL